jgi:putative hydroxymethylpyrimidine transporter CytX
VEIIKAPEWGITPIPDKGRKLGGLDFFILWSSLGVGLLVLSAGSFLSEASFIDATLAIIAGSVGGSILLALAGKIGSDHGVTSIVSMRPAFGIRGSYLPAVLNVVQLVGWTTFEIMIMARAAALLSGNAVPYPVLAAVFGAIVALLGIAGPLAVARQWLGKFAVWIAYGTSIIIIVTLLMSPGAHNVITSPGKGMSFFTAFDLVIAMPISWMPLVADYNRFAKKSRTAFWPTLIGFALTNTLFYFGGVLLGTFDVLAIIVAMQTIFFGFLMLLLLVDEADNAFADLYSAAVSVQNIFPHLSQKHLIIGFTALSTLLATVVTMQDYENFLLLIGAIFVPLFGVVLADYYLVKRQKYTEGMMFGDNKKGIAWPAITAWALGTLLNFVMSPLSPLYVPSMPAIGATIPSLAAASLAYLAITRLVRKPEAKLAK